MWMGEYCSYIVWLLFQLRHHPDEGLDTWVLEDCTTRQNGELIFGQLKATVSKFYS